MPPRRQRIRTSFILVPLLLAGMVLLVIGGSWGSVADAGTATNATSPPSTNPPSTNPPPSTSVPPTEIPATEVPATEVPATEIPATEVPATESPTEAPTEIPPTVTLTPAPFPSSTPVAPVNPPPEIPVVRPSPSPAVADEATVTCAPASSVPVLAAGGEEWALQTCTLALDFGAVEALDIRGATTAPGWRIILVARDARDTPGLLDASNSRLAIDDLAGTTRAEFLVGARASCTAVTATTLELEITGTRPDDGGTVTTTGTIDLAATGAGAPAVQLAALDINEGADGTRATIEIDYRDAPAACGWQLLVTFGTAESGLVVPAGGALTLASVTGPDGITSAVGDGTVSVLVPAGGDKAGSVTITTVIDGQGGAPAFDAVIVNAFPAP